MVFLLACSAPELVYTPDSLAFGHVDFAGEMPEEGYAKETVSVANAGGGVVALSLPEYDTERLCLAGFVDRTYPVDLGELAPGATYLFEVGVCAYLPSELTQLVSTELVVKADGEPFVLPITFNAERSD